MNLMSQRVNRPFIRSEIRKVTVLPNDRGGGTQMKVVLRHVNDSEKVGLEYFESTLIVNYDSPSVTRAS
jgi:hypothetical protein